MKTNRILQAGIKVLDITPSNKVLMDGYGDRTSLSEGVHDPLLAQILVVKSGHRKVCFLVLDLLSVDADFTKKLRSDIYEATKIPIQSIQIICTHTHGGPIGFRSKPSISEAKSVKEEIENHRLNVHRQLLNGVVKANQTLKPVFCKFGDFQTSGIAANRLQKDGAIDNTISVFLLYEIDNPHRPLLILVNYGCHPTVLDRNNLMITSDYPHYVRAYIQDHFHSQIPVFFVNGASGNISTRFTRQGSDFEESRRIGSLVGAGAIQAINNSFELDAYDFKLLQFKSDLPIKDLPSLEAAQMEFQRTKQAADSIDRQITDAAHIRLIETEYYGARANLSLVKQGLNPKKQAEINLISFGKLVFVIIPAELFSDLGLEIKKRSPFSKTLIFGYANDALGYIPSEDSYSGSGYEVRRTLFAAGAGEYLVEQIIHNLNKLRKSD